MYLDCTENKINYSFRFNKLLIRIRALEPIFINGTKVPYANTAKYLGMTLDAKLRWKEHS
jgi:hypothetical protein